MTGGRGEHWVGERLDFQPFWKLCPTSLRKQGTYPLVGGFKDVFFSVIFKHI